MKLINLQFSLRSICPEKKGFGTFSHHFVAEGMGVGAFVLS